jgi:hypothetical protein
VASPKRRFSRSKWSEYLCPVGLIVPPHRMEGVDPEPVLVTKWETTLDTKMDGFEKLLGKQRYMAGDVSVVFVIPVPRPN